MALEEKQVTAEEAVKHHNQMEESRSKLSDLITSGDVFKSLDLPTTEDPNPPEQDKKKPVDEEQEVDEEEQTETEDVSETGEQEESQEQETTETEEQDEDGDLIPKSKVQKRFDALTAKIKQLESEIARGKVPDVKDELTLKLETMSEQELRQAKREARLAQIKHADDEARVNQLIDLEDKIDATIQNAPKRFNNAQVAKFNAAAESISLKAIEDGVDINKAAESIKKIALEIYSETPEFQKSVEGQANALRLAYRHYKEISKLGVNKVGKSQEVNRLKSQVNSLKKKTSLDTKVIKGNMDKTRSEDIRRKAMNGTYKDKLAFISDDKMFRVDDMIPPEYRG